MSLFALAPAARAQFDTAAVVGSVTDPAGAAVAGAQVQLRNLELKTVLKRSTDSKGSYEFPDVQIGTYTVTVSAGGFAESITKPFDLTVGARQKIDVPLTVGGTTDSITVSVDNAGLQTEGGEQSTTVESQEILDLPLNGREYTDLALLAPGVQVGSLQDGTVGQRRGSFVVNGNRSSVNNFLLDGLDNNSYQQANQGFNNQAVPQSADAVQEYSIITSNFPAEYGRAGGAIVNVKTKSGSDALHATLYEYIRNTALNAYGPFYGQGQKPTLVQNQFGGSLGWHVPKVKNLFFFIDYEGFRQATKTISSATLPTADQRNGILYNETGVAVPVQNPFTGKQYPTGVIPKSDFTPFAAAVLADLPAPTSVVVPGGGANFVGLEAGHNYRDLFDLRLDKYIGQRLQAFVRFSKQSNHITTPPSITGPAGGNGFGHIRVLTTAGVAGATYVVSPNSLVDVRFGVIYAESGKVPYNQGVPNYYSRFNMPLPIDPSLPQSGLNTQSVLDFSTFGVEATQNQYSNPQTYNLKGNYTLSHGRHSMSFGYEWLHLDYVEDPGSPLLGEDTYLGEFSYYAAPARPASSVGRRQAYGLADFIFGARDTYQLSNYTVDTQYFDYHYAYAEDTWKVGPRLTVNYGLRYEFSTPERVKERPLANFDPTTNALEVSTTGSIYNEALVNPKLDNFAPRFGFAYSLFPNIVVRGGYGLSFIQFNRYGSESDLTSNGPFTIDGNVTQNLAQPICPAGSQSLNCFRPTMQGYPSSLISAAGFSTANTETTYMPRDTPTGYVESYSLGTQVQIDPATIFRLSYVGTHDVHLRVLGDLNETAPQAPGGSLTLAQRRPIQNFGNIHESSSAGYLKYNSLQAQVQHRMAGGLFLLDSFTWSHAEDNASASLELAHGDSEFISLRNIKYDNGTSGYDQRWNNSLAAVWKIPYGTHLRNRGMRQVAGGWTLTTITRTTSGIPLNVYYTPADNDLTTEIGSYRPNITGFVYSAINPRSKWTVGTSGTCNGYCNVFNKSQFSAPTPAASGGTTPYGNMPRNGLTGPGYANIDFSVQKNFTLPERMRLQLRAEAFDVLNHTNFKAPNTNFSSASFGVFAPSASSVFPSRQLQFAIRLAY